MRTTPFAAALLLAWAAAAQAEVATVSPSGFVVVHKAEVKAAPAQVYQALGHPESWWNGAHTYSGKAANLSLGLNAGDCFCERWDGGSVEHARVIYSGKDSTLKLLGSLGPLQGLAVTGLLTFSIVSKDGATTLSATYRVSGNADSGLDKWAGPVDQVIGEQVKRLAAFSDGRGP